MKHILLTTDLSEEAQRSFEPARALAEKLGARLTLLHVIESITKVASGGMFATPVAAIDPEQEREIALGKLAKQREEFGPELEVDTEVLASANVAAAIADFADSHGVDLIALSTHGYSGLRRLVMGSVAEEIIRRSHVPILAFPPGPAS